MCHGDYFFVTVMFSRPTADADFATVTLAVYQRNSVSHCAGCFLVNFQEQPVCMFVCLGFMLKNLEHSIPELLLRII